LLANNSVDKTIIFSSSKQNVKDVYNALLRMKIKVGAMHSDLDQAFRDEVMLDYKSGKINVIVATDILSRGIDIEGIDMVINYDVPHDAEDYIHRIGRTARANRQGVGITFVSEKDQDRFGMIEQFLEKEIEKMPLPEELGEGPAYEPRLKGKGGRRRQNDSRRQTAKGKQPNANSHKPNADGKHNNKPKADGNESQEPKANRQHFKPNANGDESNKQRRYNNHHRRFNNRNRGNNNSQQGDLAKDDSVG
jgi:superfamily II DNA/RNA helicase